MHTPKAQTIWLSLPGFPGRHLRVEYVTEVTNSDAETTVETTTATEAAAVLKALQNKSSLFTYHLNHPED